MKIYAATRNDVAIMLEIRLMVRENVMSRTSLEALGIHEESLVQMLETSHSGFCAEEDGRVIGFSMADRNTASVFALFVHPDFEGRGAGTALLDAAVADLAAAGHERISLTTDPGTRAFYFYLQQGWRHVGPAPNGEAAFELEVGEAASESTADSGVQFRAARREDVERIVELLANDPLGSKREDYRLPLPQRYFDAFAAIDGDPNHELVVATDGDQVIGCLQLSILPYLTYRGGFRAQIEGVRVATGFRSRGIGRAIFEWAITRARERGCHVVQLTTDKSRPDALRFYEDLGFVASHEGMKLHLKRPG